MIRGMSEGASCAGQKNPNTVIKIEALCQFSVTFAMVFFISLGKAHLNRDGERSRGALPSFSVYTHREEVKKEFRDDFEALSRGLWMETVVFGAI